MSTLGGRIKSAREENKLLQGELAKLIGVKSSGVISNWEKDLNKPDAEKIVKLCEVLNVPASYLLDYYGKTPFEVNPQEYKLIEKYRSLDQPGREHVDTVIQWESDRAEQIASISRQVLDLKNQLEDEQSIEDFRRQISEERRTGKKSEVCSTGNKKEA